MTDAKHRLVQVTCAPEGGWSGTCTCGRWGFAGADTKQRLYDKHEQHVREARR